MTRFSLRGRIVTFVLGSLALVWLALLAWNYHEAREEIGELSDARLEETARTLLQLDLKRLTRLVDADSNARAADAGDAAGHHTAFQVWSDDGTLLLHSTGAPAIAFDRHDGLKSLLLGGAEWRSYAAHDTRRGYQVRVYESSRARDALVDKLARRTAQALLVALPALALLMWIGIGRGLRPLRRLSREIATRDANRLEPVAIGRVSSEAQPLIDALNRLFVRLAESLDRERAFTADAAHELRTPLAAIKVQAEVARAARDDAERRHAIDQIIHGVERTTRLAQQLLLLARLDHPEAATRGLVDLGRAAAESAARLADSAIGKGIELEVDAAPGCALLADPHALAILLDNLLDNAIKYGRPQGRIVLSVRCEDTALALRVADDGPGVSADKLARLADRFYRVGEGDAQGSGLGLAIVARIARVYGGTVRFGAGIDGLGLGVDVRFAAPAFQPASRHGDRDA